MNLGDVVWWYSSGVLYFFFFVKYLKGTKSDEITPLGSTLVLVIVERFLVTVMLAVWHEWYVNIAKLI